MDGVSTKDLLDAYDLLSTGSNGRLRSILREEILKRVCLPEDEPAAQKAAMLSDRDTAKACIGRVLRDWCIDGWGTVTSLIISELENYGAFSQAKVD